MKLPLLFVTIFIVRANSLCQLPTKKTDCIDNKTKAWEYVNSLSDSFDRLYEQHMYASWNYQTNQDSDEYDGIFAREARRVKSFTGAVTSNLTAFCWKNFKDTKLARLAAAYFLKGDLFTNETLEKALAVQGRMDDLYATKLRKFENSNTPNCKRELKIRPHLKEAMAKIGNHDELKYYWTKWHNEVGNGMRHYFIEIAKIRQEADKLMGFKNPVERQLQGYKTNNFQELMEQAYTKTFELHGETLSLEILYKEIHTFVKGKLINIYNRQGANIEKDGPIPAHLLGDMFAEHWKNIIDLALPFPNASAINVTKNLLEKNKTVKNLVRMADKFFMDLGFKQMTPKFWNYSQFEKPNDGRVVNCQARPWNLNNNDDFRIQMCAKVTLEDLITTHKEMGHIVFYDEVKHLPYGYRGAANPAIQDALGDLMGLAAMSSSYLKHLGLLDPVDNPNSNNMNIDYVQYGNVSYRKSDINYMMKVALEKIVHLPFCLARESWGWRYLSGKSSDSTLNNDFWKIVLELQGLKPPVDRNETNFDPGADYNIVDRVPLIDYYFAYISQFQFYEALCKEAAEYNPDDPAGQPLHQCDFSVEGESVGNILKNAMRKGKTVHWTKFMEDVAKVDKLSGESMVKYFLPLYKFLKKENAEGEVTPWK